MIRSIGKDELDFEEVKQVREEIEILQMCREQPNIVRLVDSFEDCEAFHLVFHSSPSLTLKDYFLQ